MRWAGHEARMEEDRNAFKLLAGTLTGNRPLGRPKRRLENNIRMDLKEMGINTSNWVDSIQGKEYWRARVNETLNLRVPQAMMLVMRKRRYDMRRSLSPERKIDPVFTFTPRLDWFVQNFLHFFFKFQSSVLNTSQLQYFMIMQDAMHL